MNKNISKMHITSGRNKENQIKIPVIIWKYTILKCIQTAYQITGSDVCVFVLFRLFLLQISHKIRNHEATKCHRTIPQTGQK